MSRNLNAHNDAEVILPVTSPYYLIKIDFTSAAKYYSTRWATTWDGNSYIAGRQITVGTVGFTAKGTQTCSLSFGDSDSAMSTLFLAEDATDIACEIHKVYGEPSNPIDINNPVQVFKGVINDRTMTDAKTNVQMLSSGTFKFSPGITINSTDFSHLPAAAMPITSGTTVTTLKPAPPPFFIPPYLTK